MLHLILLVFPLAGCDSFTPRLGSPCCQVCTSLKNGFRQLGEAVLYLVPECFLSPLCPLHSLQAAPYTSMERHTCLHRNSMWYLLWLAEGAGGGAGNSLAELCKYLQAFYTLQVFHLSKPDLEEGLKRISQAEMQISAVSSPGSSLLPEGNLRLLTQPSTLSQSKTLVIFFISLLSSLVHTSCCSQNF